ncbi:related to tubulin-specific chaperone e (tubulin folding cofactor E) [Cephalotrichum gorgonifer]|uniref:Related to tubulin-specific chaperone e (Tubulin folding cofactor E) n=1 Tax=Cephalotrichum gorgonifer TaxID=2041049 RepID=A0AAE8MVS7_9PEZI|nr:related to tubulin-specific chaperone e (tubulin folding cofactor E) [Cephalotrichum gorgonifer]
MASTPMVGQRLSYDDLVCTVRYVGEVAGTSGAWLGVEWDDPTRGKHDGSHKGVKYFECLSKSSTAASFVRPSRPSQAPQSFISALHEKYASEVDSANRAISSGRLIEISGKVVEEVGFDKIRRQLARVGDLKIVILNGMRVGWAVGEGEASVAETCPKITELDLSHNLFVDFGTSVGVCRDLPELRSLRLNGNRFQDVLGDEWIQNAGSVFSGVKELALEETFLRWDEICHIARKFGSLASLSCGTNQLAAISGPLPAALSSTLTILNLEWNGFTALSDLTMLSSLTSLRNLHLKGNNISALTSNPSSSSAAVPTFPESIQYVDLSYNQVPSWSFVDSLHVVFPGLTALRIAHNPIYGSTEQSNTQQGPSLSATTTEEAHMITIARLPRLRTLNFATVSDSDRSNAEMFYLSRVAKELAAVPEGAESEVLKAHPRYEELCALHGTPDVIRRQETNPEFLESRLINVTFRYVGGGGEVPITKTKDIPNSFDIYAVKGMTARMFGLSPLRIRLFWETGEWDPVAGFDEQEGDSSDEEEEVAEAEMEWVVGGPAGGDEEGHRGWEGVSAGATAGRWVKREAELRDSPRALKFCVDGQEAKIRVEDK